jgi:hypothetical protein
MPDISSALRPWRSRVEMRMATDLCDFLFRRTLVPNSNFVTPTRTAKVSTKSSAKEVEMVAQLVSLSHQKRSYRIDGRAIVSWTITPHIQ